jgi:hypothetical protein
MPLEVQFHAGRAVSNQPSVIGYQTGTDGSLSNQFNKEFDFATPVLSCFYNYSGFALYTYRLIAER